MGETPPTSRCHSILTMPSAAPPKIQDLSHAEGVLATVEDAEGQTFGDFRCWNLLEVTGLERLKQVKHLGIFHGISPFSHGIFQPLEMVISWDSISQEWSSNGRGNGWVKTLGASK